MCVGDTATYTTASTGGNWITTGRAIINTNGFATATSAGTSEVRYVLTNANGCSAYSSLSITVNALPAIPSIAFASGTPGSVVGSGGYCKNKIFTLVGSPANGIWSKIGVITISPANGAPSTNLLVGKGNLTGATSITYKITDAKGCMNSRTISTNIVNCGSKGVNVNENLANSSFVLYPNPASSIAQIQLTKLVGNGQLVVTDALGKTVITQNVSIGNNKIDVSKLSKGLYFVTLVSGDEVITKKLIKE